MSEHLERARRLMGEGDYAGAVEELFERLQAAPQDPDARRMLRECLAQQDLSGQSGPPASQRSSGLRIYSLSVAMAMPWMAALVALLLTLGPEHYTVSCVAGAGAIILPFAAALGLPLGHRAKPILDRLTVTIAFGWLATSTLWMFARTDALLVNFTFACLFLGSIFVPLMVLWLYRGSKAAS